MRSSPLPAGPSADAADEAALAARAQGGDEDAFAELVRRHQDMVYAVTWRMTGSAADAADLTQETFVRAWRGLAEFRGGARLSSWLYRVAMNASLNWLAAARRREDRLDEASPYLAGQERAAVPDELSARVEEALLALPPAQRAAVVLTLFEGLNHAEAAHVLGCAETTVSWRVFRARRELRSRLACFVRRPPPASHESP
jgi:RNA polymerase sigma-70 factor (ECF subfamily)